MRQIIKNRWLCCGCAAAAVFGALIFTIGTVDTFAIWGIKASSPDFADARGITTAIESHVMGKDPLVENPRDPLGRPFNYPRVWLELHRFGINQSHTTALAMTLIVAFLLGLLVFPLPDLGLPGCGLLMLAAFSPATVLGMERGNIDLLMFLLVALGIAGFSSGNLAIRRLGTACVLLGFVLKIFPVFALAMLGGEPRARLRQWAACVIVIVAVYVFMTWEDLLLIYRSTPKSTGVSYGMNVLWMELLEHGKILGFLARAMAWGGVCIAAILTWMGHRDGISTAGAIRSGDRPLVAFRAGAGIYGGTFLLGNNWDYRLIFLLFTLPLLVRLIRGARSLQRTLAVAVLASIFVSLWSISIYRTFGGLPFGSEACVLLDETANWVIFLGLGYLFGSTLSPAPDDSEFGKSSGCCLPPRSA